MRPQLKPWIPYTLLGLAVATATAAAVFQPSEPFTVVLIPDTQHYTMQAGDHTYEGQSQWILDHSEPDNIVFAIHLGDITQSNETSQDEWRRASRAHDRLDAAGMPYSVLPGNHDYPKRSGSVLRRELSYYNYYFGPGRFAGREWYRAHYPPSPSRNENNVTFFEGGGSPYMVVSLEFAPRKDALCWADSVVQAHPERRAIIATHCYIDENGYRRCGTDEDYSIVGGDGETIWNELVRRNNNIMMVVSGHFNGVRHFRKLRATGAKVGDDIVKGDIVTEILTDYQSEPFLTPLGRRHGNGWLRTMRFTPNANQLELRARRTRTDVTRFFLGTEPDYDGVNDSASAPHTETFPLDLSSWKPAKYVRFATSASFDDRTINTEEAGNQRRPAISSAPNGDFVVVWEDDSRPPNGVYQIKARAFRADGCERLPEFSVNGVAKGQQFNPSIAVDTVGGFVVAWADDFDGNGSYEIRVKGYNADGTERFGDITANTQSSGQQLRPVVAVDGAGNFVVAWEDDSNPNGVFQIHARGFHANGTPRFGEIAVNQIATGQQRHPSISMHTDGSFVVVWEDDSSPPHGIYNIYARQFTANGAGSTQFRVNSNADGQQLNPSVALDENHNFCVVWEDDSQPPHGVFNIYARGFDVTGHEVFADRRVNSNANGQQFKPDVRSLPSGKFAIVWEDDNDGNHVYEIRGRIVTTAGGILSDVAVNKNARGQQRSPRVAVRSGSLVVVWEDDVERNNVLEILGRGMPEW